jgi:hypothetical protein
VSYTGTLLVGAHHRNPVTQMALDLAQLAGLVGHLLTRLVVFVWRHLHGLVVIVASTALTVGVSREFLLAGEEFPALMSALIGLLSIAVGITYHSLGEPKR